LVLGFIVAVLVAASCTAPTNAPTATTAAPSPDSPAASVPDATVPDDTNPTFDLDNPLRIGTMRGPSSMGLAPLMDDPRYEFDVVGSPDQLTARLVTGELDAAVLPVNVAATLFNRVPGELKLAAVTSLGALYAVTADPDVNSIADLAGHTVISAGRGGTPQTVLDALLAGADVDATVDYRAEPPEVIGVLSRDPSAVAILPEPFVTSALAQDPDLRVAVDLNAAWDELTGAPLATTVLMVRTAFNDERPGDVAGLVADIAHTTNEVNEDPTAAAAQIVELGIVPNEAIAAAAIPRSNLVTWSGPNGREAVAATLQAMYQSNPASVGGTVPDEAFYLD